MVGSPPPPGKPILLHLCLIFNRILYWEDTLDRITHGEGEYSLAATAGSWGLSGYSEPLLGLLPHLCWESAGNPQGLGWAFEILSEPLEKCS